MPTARDEAHVTDGHAVLGRTVGWLGALLALVGPAASQPYLSSLEADAQSALFATYAAPIERSEFIVDQGYHFRYYEDGEGIDFTTDAAGTIGLAVRMGDAVRYRAGDMYEPPSVTASYSDLVRYRYRPFEHVLVQGHFQVYSSRLALLDVRITNTGETPATIGVYPLLRHAMSDVRLTEDNQAWTFEHVEPPDEWTVAHSMPHLSTVRNDLLIDPRPDAVDAYTSVDSLFSAVEDDRLDGVLPDDGVQAVAFRRTVRLDPGEMGRVRVVRSVADPSSNAAAARTDAVSLFDYDVDAALREDERRYERIPKLRFDDPDLEAAYWSAFSLLRQVMLPPEGRSSYNYYVFSREPIWGWGHGGQVFHESLSMLAYVFMDPEGAMDSQRVYMERQHVDGYINYRTGGFLDETIPTDGRLTSSAPWYNWINWELFRQTRDEAFLEEAYASGSRFYEWWLENRDRDGDGLAEWGGHAVLESVRDGAVAVWDEVGHPTRLEALDLNSMLVVEARSLASMAAVLGNSAAAASWRQEARTRADAVNTTFWDDSTGFYYHVDRDDHDFTLSRADDLKRREIIGFLPLWAGIASEAQAERLLAHLTDSSSFGRPFGVPTLAADDPYYDPMGYWNGPVWVEWQYLIFRGLLDNGYTELAADLADRVIENVVDRLKETHTFWELYSPDAHESGHHQTYIWTGLVARMILDLRQ